MTESEARGLFAAAGFEILRMIQLPNGYYRPPAPLTDDQIERDTPGTSGFVRTGDGPTEGVVRRFMREYAWTHREPWWFVKTQFGFIEIGWRKRVIQIDWSETGRSVDVTADDVTKEPTLVHAWSMPKALEYLTALRVAMDVAVVGQEQLK